MKTINKIFLILILFCLPIFSQLSKNFWFQQGPFGGSVYQMSVSSNDILAVITNAGGSVLSYDWIEILDDKDLTLIEFQYDNWLIGIKSNQVYKSNDYGYHWYKIYEPEDSIKGMTISKVSPYNIYVWSNSSFYYGTSNDSIWNKGKMKLDFLYPSPTDSNKIYASNNAGLYKSLDNGKNWDQILDKSISHFSITDDLPNVIYAVEKDTNLIYISLDDGENWNASNNGLPTDENFYINNILAHPIQNGIAYLSTNYGIFRTTNLGNNWFRFSNNLNFPEFGESESLSVNKLIFFNNKLYAATNEGVYLNINPNNDEWQQIGPHNVQVNSISKAKNFFNEFIYLGTPKGIFYSYYYNDIRPSNLYSQKGININKILLLNGYDYAFDNKLVASQITDSNSAIIYSSISSGVDWNEVLKFPKNSGKINNFFNFIDSTNIVLALRENCDSTYGIYKSENNGELNSWFPVENSKNLNVKDITQFEQDTTELFLLVNDTSLYYSPDRGNTLKFISHISDEKLKGIYSILRNDTNYIFAYGKGIKVSSDSGLTWNNFGLDTTEIIELSHDYSSLIAATKNNGLLIDRYFNGVWYPYELGLPQDIEITDMANFTHSIVHIGTANNSVFMMYLFINSITDKFIIEPDKYYLSQNYPNPFNPTTKIRYYLPHTSFVTLKVYDILGQEVTTLVDEEKPFGNYEVEFSAKGLSGGMSAKGGYASGVYFYRLEVKNLTNGKTFNEVKKMILLK